MNQVMYTLQCSYNSYWSIKYWLPILFKIVHAAGKHQADSSHDILIRIYANGFFSATSVVVSNEVSKKNKENPSHFSIYQDLQISRLEAMSLSIFWATSQKRSKRFISKKIMRLDNFTSVSNYSIKNFHPFRVCISLHLHKQFRCKIIEYIFDSGSGNTSHPDCVWRESNTTI